MKVYARVVDGKIVEYPVYASHIANRKQPIEWYTEVTFDVKPTVPQFSSLQETPVLQNDGSVRVSYAVFPIPLQGLLASLYNDPAHITNPNATVTYASIDPAKVARIIKLVEAYVNSLLNDFAATRHYDSILSAASYVTSTNTTFAAEGARCVTIRDQTWAALYAYLAAVQAGSQPVPKTVADIEAQLPARTWS